MRKFAAFALLVWVVAIVKPLSAQHVDVGFGMGTISAPSGNNSTNFVTFTQSLRGGTYVGLNGDVLFHGNFGVQAEINWRASQGAYGGQTPYRPLFWDFNGIYSRRFSKLIGAEVLAGIGAESVRFYQGQYNCDFYGNCTNYVSSTHFMGDFGGGIKIYPYHNFFVRPEMRLYLINNNVEFGSALAVRYGATIGYTFGGSR